MSKHIFIPLGAVAVVLVGFPIVKPVIDDITHTSVQEQFIADLRQQADEQDPILTLVFNARVSGDEAQIDAALAAFDERMAGSFSNAEERRRLRLFQIDFLNDVAGQRRDRELLEAALQYEREFEDTRNPDITPNPRARSQDWARLGRLLWTQARLSGDPEDYAAAHQALTQSLEALAPRERMLFADDHVWNRATVLAEWAEINGDTGMMDESTAEFELYRDEMLARRATALSTDAQIQIAWNALARSEMTGDMSALPAQISALENTIEGEMEFLDQMRREKIAPVIEALETALAETGTP